MRRRSPTCTLRCWIRWASGWIPSATAVARWANCWNRQRSSFLEETMRSPALLLLLPIVAAAADPRIVDAARVRDQAVLRKLVTEQTDVNTAGADGGTAMHWAAYHDDIEAARLLVKAGAHVN